MSKVLVGMSGGVDSAVAAYLLKKEGYDVTGVTLRTWASSDGSESRCCEIDDARAAAREIGITYYAFNCVEDFRKKVIEPFVACYARGLTPNPCVGCNRNIKWEKMLYFARVLHADYIATGHYASAVRLRSGRYTVRKALHAEKDQTYMLCSLTQQQLAATIMPLGGLSKAEVRQIAKCAGISSADKPDSQEICFVPDGDYSDFIRQHSETALPGEGLFLDESGKALGVHKGIYRYTVGQRRGLGLALGYNVYVKKIAADKNVIILGKDESLYSSELICGDLNFMSIRGINKDEVLKCLVKVRYQHRAQSAQAEMTGPDTMKISFDEPVRAAAPGQYAVLYDGDGCVICGGIIREVL